MAYRKKLIEVALPLDDINFECSREKSLRHGHPSTMHLWWARRPLAACRAVLFASLVDDPSSRPDLFPTLDDQEIERQRLFTLIRKMVIWENLSKEELWNDIRSTIVSSCESEVPPVLDAFCGGGSIPLEAQRLGLESFGADLNPVAVMITKALVELPKVRSGLPPVHKSDNVLGNSAEWERAQGLAEDIRHYGSWMCAKAKDKIGVHYPHYVVNGSAAQTVVAWIWARTVMCPNPGCQVRTPLVRSFWLSKKKGREAWVETTVVDRTVEFSVQCNAKGPRVEGTVNRQGAVCVSCNAPIPFDHIRKEAKENPRSLEPVPMAMVVDGGRNRKYVDFTLDQRDASLVERAQYNENANLPQQALGFRVRAYGYESYFDLFSDRQLLALTTFSDLVIEARDQIVADGGTEEYANAVATYLAFAVDRSADYWSSLCSWHVNRETLRNVFTRQAIAMAWDYAEANPFSTSSGNWLGAIGWIAEVVEQLPAQGPAHVLQHDASTPIDGQKFLISIDPPYYDNIGYADFSDFFYMWMRRSLKSLYPDIMSTLMTPKSLELVATPYRFEGSRDRAREHFEQGIHKAFAWMRDAQDERFPMTIYYAFKQSEDRDGTGHISTGWESMLQGLLDAGIGVVGTWPMRSEMANRMLASGTNALASSIVLVCRPLIATAPLATRREFIQTLHLELPKAIRTLTATSIAPVDLAQASIGPGMEIFSRFSRVIDSEGRSIKVGEALALINTALNDIVSEQEGELDSDTRWAVAWFEQNGFKAGKYGDAEVLSKANNIAISRLIEEGIVESNPGLVRLRGIGELPERVEYLESPSISIWMVTHQLIHLLVEGGEHAAAELFGQIGGLKDSSRDLAYRLYLICEKKKWSEEAQMYNILVTSWNGMLEQAGKNTAGRPQQLELKA